jgi:hypothetical protein
MVNPALTTNRSEKDGPTEKGGVSIIYNHFHPSVSTHDPIHHPSPASSSAPAQTPKLPSPTAVSDAN